MSNIPTYGLCEYPGAGFVTWKCIFSHLNKYLDEMELNPEIAMMGATLEMYREIVKLP